MQKLKTLIGIIGLIISGIWFYNDPIPGAIACIIVIMYMKNCTYKNKLANGPCTVLVYGEVLKWGGGIATIKFYLDNGQGAKTTSMSSGKFNDTRCPKGTVVRLMMNPNKYAENYVISTMPKYAGFGKKCGKITAVYDLMYAVVIFGLITKMAGLW